LRIRGGSDDHLVISRFDPHMNEEFRIGTFPFIFDGSLASLQDSLFLIGGSYFCSAEVKVFNVIEKRLCSRVRPMSEGRSHCAVANSSREILVCGGHKFARGLLSSCELFQPARNRFIPMPHMETARTNFQVVWLPDGRIFALGGENAGCLKSVEMLNREWQFEGQTTGEWRQCSCMLTARRGFAAVVLHDEYVLVTGGQTCYGYCLASVDLFTPPPAVNDPYAVGQWTCLQSMQSVPSDFCTGVFSGGAVFIFEASSRTIRRFRRSGMEANQTASGKFDDWSWDEGLSLTTTIYQILSSTFP